MARSRQGPDEGQRPRTAADRVERERRYMVALGQRIRGMREERGLTQQAVAEIAGVATDMVSRLENGRYTSPGLRTLLRIADALGVPLASVMPDAGGAVVGSAESALKARLLTLAHRARPQDLELVVELAQTVINRSGRA